MPTAATAPTARRCVSSTTAARSASCSRSAMRSCPGSFWCRASGRMARPSRAPSTFCARTATPSWATARPIRAIFSMWRRGDAAAPAGYSIVNRVRDREGSPMKYDVISADCHVDLIWLPPDLFTANAPAALKERMPYVTDGPRGKEWVTRNGASFGLMNGMGSAGRQYVPGVIHRSDRMASTGLYEDGQKGVRRLTDPDLRLKEQDRDGVQAEILYGILGATNRLNDNEAAGTMLRIYNDWLADFCGHHPERFAGLACIPNHDTDAAVGEIERGARAAGAFPHDRRRPPRFLEAHRQDPARGASGEHFEFPDAHGRRLDVGD